jgi:hypothetical protein
MINLKNGTQTLEQNKPHKESNDVMDAANKLNVDEKASKGSAAGSFFCTKVEIKF